MTASAGTIGIGVSINADGLTDELTREVGKAMESVLRQMNIDVGRLSEALRGLNTSDMADRMARDAEAMEEAIRNATDSIDELGDQSDETAEDIEDLTDEVEGLGDEQEKTGKKTEKHTGLLGKMGGAVSKAAGTVAKFGGILAGVAGLGGVGMVLTKGLDRLTSIEDARAKLEGLHHDVESIDAIMSDAMAAVKGTAFGMGDAATVAASVVAAGVKPGKDLERTLTLVGDAATIAGVEMDAMGAIFGKVAATGKVSGREMAQLTTAGIPALALLSDELGKTSEEVNQMVSKGEVDFETFQRAIEKGMGGAARAGVTFSAATANMGAALGRLGAAILDAPFGAAPNLIGKMTGAVDDATDKVKGLQEVLISGDFGEAFKKAFPDMEEDAGFVNFLFNVREGVLATISAFELFRTGNFTGEIGKALGVEEDSPLVDRILTVRDMVSDWTTRVMDLFRQLGDGAKALIGPITDIIQSLSTASAAIGVSVWEILLRLLEALVPLLISTLIPAVETLARLMEENQTVVTVLVGAFTAYKVVTLASTVATKAFTVAQKLYAASTKAATGATRGFNAALKANMIGIIVTAVIGLVMALKWFFTETELGRDLFEKFKNAMVTAWDAIKGAFESAWEWIKGAFDGIKDAISSVISFIGDNWQIIISLLLGPLGVVVATVVTYWDEIKAGFSTAVDAIAGVLNWLWKSVVQPVWNGIASAISSVWNGLILPIFNAWRTVIMGVIVPVLMFLWNSVISPVFGWIGDKISSIWNTVISVVFAAFRAGMDAVGAVVTWLWDSVIKPSWDGIGKAISWVWDNVISPVFDFFKAGMELVGDVASWLWNDIITPVWNGIGDAISWVIDNIVIPAWDKMKSALQTVGDFFSTVVDGIRSVWDGLRNILAKPINFMIGTVYNNGIRKAWNKIGEFIPGLVEAPELDTIPEFATGGALRGKGTGTSDEILMWGSNGEHMVTAKEVMRAGGHNILYAIRDMIARGIPFTWDNGRVVSEVGENNLSRYGAAVQRQGIGNVPPEGLFDPILPRFKDGGAIILEPWMLQLAEGHKFAQSQSGKPYQWAGPRFVNDSFDCSGYMGSIAAAILGGNVWQRYWATGSFGRGQGPGGPQGFVPGVDAGFTIGVTDDPGGPGGGHTAGVLGAVPGMFGVARVESGGALGDVHYGAGPDVMSFLGQYHLPIGANGFFQPGIGGTAGPSPEEQRSFLAEQAGKVLRGITDPIKGMISSEVGDPPPHWKAIPPNFLDGGVDAVVGGIDAVIGDLGDMLSSAWTAARSIGGSVLDALNPFDSGGIARGVGMMPKNVIAPERVLSPEQTKLFEILVQSLQALSKGDYDGGLHRVGIEEDHPFVDAVLTMQEVASSVDNLVNKGDYDGVMHRFGIEEDHPLIDAVLTMREVAESVDNLITKGDYDGVMHRFGVEEDHPLVDAVLTMREVATSVDALVNKGDYDGTMSRFGVEEDHPLIDAVLSVREATLGVGDLIEKGNEDAPEIAVTAEIDLENDHPFVEALRGVLDVARSIDTLINEGDYTSGLRRLGLEEDHPIVGAVLDMRSIALAVDNLVNRGDYDGRLSRFGIEEDHPAIDAVLTMREVAQSIDALVHQGDYDGTLSRFGVEEDHPVIDAVLTMRELTESVGALVHRGDYDGTMSRFGIEEDHPLIDAVLSVREVAESMRTLAMDGDYDGIMSRYGVEEDHPLIDAVLSVREGVVEALDSNSTKLATTFLDSLGTNASKVVGDLSAALVPQPKDMVDVADPTMMQFMEEIRDGFDEQGQLISDTQDLARRNQSSTEQVLVTQYSMLEDQVLDVANRLSSGVLGPVVQTAMQSALGVVTKGLEASTADITTAQNETTDAVKDIDLKKDEVIPFGAPGSAFDLAKELSDAVVKVTDVASQSLMQVGMDIAKAALQQQKSSVENPRGVLGDDNNSGGVLVDTIVRLTGVEIQIRDTIDGIAADVKSFRGDQFQAFDETGALLSDTASLLERSASSTDMVIAEQNRINRELMKSVMRYLMVNVLLPILSALLTALITIMVTLVVAAIGFAIAGPIGAAIGAAVGGLIGLALSAVAATVLAGVGLGAASAIDSFDEGGIAHGIGVLPKNTIRPERVLSPRQTESFDRLVDTLDGRGGAVGSKSIHIGNVNVHGTQAAEKTSDHLLTLLNS